MSEQDPTADYRKYPKSPSFLMVVVYACFALIIVLAVALTLAHHKAAKMTPAKPEPTPNSMVRPFSPATPELQQA